MATEQSEQTVEYVELLDVPVYEDNNHEIITIEEDSAMPQVITLPEDVDNSQIEEVEYIEAEEIDENHTIIVHEGRQYVIPNEQLQQAGNTIVLEDEDDENAETQYVEAESTENIFYAEVDSEVSSGQYAVLKDGKLHFRETSDDCDQSEEIQEKLRVFEQSLNNFKDENDEETPESSPEDEDSEALSQITGKNLITGQTISLSGFMEKIKRKGIGDVSSSSSSRRGATARLGAVSQPAQTPQTSSDYISVPPVNRRVVVGKTPDGRRLIGRILQIQKKVSPPGTLPHIPKQRQPRVPRRLPPRQASPPTIQTQQEAPIPQCSVLLDDNVSRTLAGLMDLETVSKRLIARRLIVRHVQRRAVGGKALPGTRRVAYYSGRMGKGPNNEWQFLPDDPTSSKNKSTLGGIDLCEDDNHHQVKLKINEDGVVFSSVEEEYVEEETITLYLTVTQDEFGKKRTKVSIPQLAVGGNTSGAKRKNEESSVRSDSSTSGGHICPTCGKKFQTPGSLRRHASVHDPSLRPLQCMTCLARFTDESSLKKHLILHSGVRPHVCGVCGKCFAHRGDLNFHTRTHDPVKRFRCEICGKQFHRHSNMVRHVDIHRQATETISSNEQNDGNSVSNHGDDNGDASTDNKRPPFTCDTCGCQYNFISSLTRHIVNNHMTAVETVEN